MNIFATDKCPVQSARALDNRRVVKMILESAQLMINVGYEYKVQRNRIPKASVGLPYKPTHVNHPCSKWVKESKENFQWLYEHYMALLVEYEAQYNKKHRLLESSHLIRSYSELIERQSFTSFANCSLFKEEQDVYLAYKLTMEEKWSKEIELWKTMGAQGRSSYKPQWRNNTIPQWVKILSEELEVKSTISSGLQHKENGGKKNYLVLQLQLQKRLH